MGELEFQNQVRAFSIPLTNQIYTLTNESDFEIEWEKQKAEFINNRHAKMQEQEKIMVNDGEHILFDIPLNDSIYEITDESTFLMEWQFQRARWHFSKSHSYDDTNFWNKFEKRIINMREAHKRIVKIPNMGVSFWLANNLGDDAYMSFAKPEDGIYFIASDLSLLNDLLELFSYIKHARKNEYVYVSLKEIF